MEFEPKRKDAKTCGKPACRKAIQRLSGGIKIDTPVHIPEPPLTHDDMRSARAALEKSLTPLSDEERMQMFLDMMPKTEWIDTGTPLDSVTRIPRNKITLIYGKPGIGKSTTANKIAANFPGKTLYIDTEAALTPERLFDLGVDPRTFTTRRLSFMEDIYKLLMEPDTMKFDLIIWDSVAGATFYSEVEGDAFDRQMGVKALIMNKLMRILPNRLDETQTTLILINQVQQGFGLYAENTPPGGKGQRHAAGIVISLTGTYPNVTVDVKKNRFGDTRKEKIKL